MSELGAFPYILVGIFGPAALWIWWALRRARRKLAEREFEAEKEFAPEEPAAPGVFLRNFSPAQRVLLRGQVSGMKFVFYGLAWTLFVVLTSSLLPGSIVSTGLQGDWMGSRAIAVWYSFLNTASLSGSAFLGVFGIFSGLAAVSGLALSAAGGRLKTKPVSRRSLYWIKVLPALGTVLAAYTAAWGLSLLVMLVCYGPLFWHPENWHGLHAGSVTHIHLGSGANGIASVDLGFPLSEQGRMVRSMRLAQTSALRMFISMALELLVGFSLAIALLLQPLQFLRTKALSAGILWALIILMEFAVMGPRLLPSRMTHVLFVYGRLGPPPAWEFVGVPIALIALLLHLGSVFNERLEI
jgi:hypothetical protein